MFLTQKRQRSSNPPDCYLHKTYILNENAFDFGPLLISKDPEKRHDDEWIKLSNVTELRITNCEKYDLSVKLCLESSLSGNDSKALRSPLNFEPESMNLKIEKTQSLTVWYFSDEAKVYKDKIVCLIKDNPNPAVFVVMWTGSKPIVKIYSSIVELSKLLLNKQLSKLL